MAEGEKDKKRTYLEIPKDGERKGKKREESEKERNHRQRWKIIIIRGVTGKMTKSQREKMRPQKKKE